MLYNALVVRYKSNFVSSLSCDIHHKTYMLVWVTCWGL
uniref:Uncharacterized protein n=1 Tax=Rhizophora mucronata TaxID=61149 RepID=A0A2P2R581_RHIMU